ncbi:MAG TPA: hypothetical protein EYQ60_19995 [Myxococcales bacterium]|nr:hypothetical protein [Myxococcales bacterium]HIL81115.1 hypothetical protein [Myxococcales bacterium]
MDCSSCRRILTFRSFC